MGTTTHPADLDLVLTELDALVGRQPGRYQFTVVGDAPSIAPRPWLHVLEVPLSSRGYPHFVRWLQGLPRHDMGLAPLVANSFNAA